MECILKATIATNDKTRIIITIRTAAVSLPYKLTPLMCLFSHYMFVGSVAGMKCALCPKIGFLSNPSYGSFLSLN
jgi:hypothetical protein